MRCEEGYAAQPRENAIRRLIACRGFGMTKPALRSLVAAGLALCWLWPGAACAQQRPARIFDVRLGAAVDLLPTQHFVQPSCGNNGGPQGLPLASFGQFRQCRPEPGGLREVWFEYDDTAEYAALARRQPGRRRTTSLLDQPVILSVLINEDGLVMGYRVITDSRAEPGLRQQAHQIALHFKARFNLDGDCADVPAAEGETPFDGEFIKEACNKDENGLLIKSQARFYYRAGQQFYDPNTGMPMANAFESSARLEVLQTKAQPAPTLSSPAKRSMVDPKASLKEGFLSGLTLDCPGCHLVEADLRYRDLSGANLEAADLEGALLHRANLSRANLRGARLNGANLNRANLSAADLRGASIVNAMAYQADVQRADMREANLSRSMMGRANFSFARLDRSILDRADLGEARLTDANLHGASLKSTQFPQATMGRANLEAVVALQGNFAEARLRGANLSHGDFRSADFSSADLTEANMTDSDLGSAKLRSADLTNVRIEGANLSQAVMPDNTRRP